MSKTAIEGIGELIIDALTSGGTGSSVGLLPLLYPAATVAAPIVAGAVGGAVNALNKEGKK